MLSVFLRIRTEPKDRCCSSISLAILKDFTYSRTGFHLHGSMLMSVMLRRLYPCCTTTEGTPDRNK